MSKKEKITITLEDLQKDPTIIKKLDDKELYHLSDLIRQEIIDKCSVYGGHLSSNLGVVELMVALFSYYDFPKDKLILDVGHQSYAQKILSGRTLDHLRQEGGTDGFQKRDESPYDCYECGHSSTSISAGMGFALSRDMKKEKYQIVSLIGDSSLANGVAFEALNSLGDFHHKMVIIVNDNEMSIAKPVGSLSRLLRGIRLSKGYYSSKNRYKQAMDKHRITHLIYKTTSLVKNFIQRFIYHETLFEEMGLVYYGIVDGYNIKAIRKALEKADNYDGPVLIHIKTKKGKGYLPAEKDTQGKYHGVSPFDKETGEFLSQGDPAMETWSKVYADELYDAMKENQDIVSIHPATGYGSHLSHIMKDFKDRSFDVGIAEEHAVLFASGIAASGHKPYVTIYSTFLQRSYDEIHHDMARMNLNVTLLVDRAGLVGDDGETHQGIYDYAYLSSIPNMTIAMAKDKSEAMRLFDFSVAFPHPLAIRFPRGSTAREVTEESKKPLSYGEWDCYGNEDSKTAIITYGPKINELREKAQNVQIVNAIFLLPLNENVLTSLLSKENIVIYDVYGTENGFARDVREKLIDLGYSGKIKIISLPNAFIKKGSVIQQERRYSVDMDSVLSYLNSLI